MDNSKNYILPPVIDQLMRDLKQIEFPNVRSLNLLIDNNGGMVFKIRLKSKNSNTWGMLLRFFESQLKPYTFSKNMDTFRNKLDIQIYEQAVPRSVLDLDVRQVTVDTDSAIFLERFNKFEFEHLIWMQKHYPKLKAILLEIGEQLELSNGKPVVCSLDNSNVSAAVIETALAYFHRTTFAGSTIQLFRNCIYSSGYDSWGISYE